MNLNRSRRIIKKKSEKGMALLMVVVLLFVMVIVVTEMLSTAYVQVFIAENLSDEHMTFYSEETLLIKIEEILFQDIEPPPMRDAEEIGLTFEDRELIRSKKGTDSFHDFWASQEVIEENGSTWIQGTIVDEERKFNINTLVNPITGKPIPKRKAFFEEILENLEIKKVDAQDIVTNIISSLDKNHDGKFDSVKLKNAQFSRVKELLSLEKIEEELYYGNKFPEGEITSETEEDYLLDDDELSLPEEGDQKGENHPFSKKKKLIYEEWEDAEIRAGLKDILTVYGNGKININTAPIPILIALFKEEDIALEIIKARKKKPLTKIDDLNNIAGASSGGAKYGDMITFHSDYYKIKMDFKHSRMGRTKYAMMKRIGTDIRVLYRGAQ